MEDTPFKPGVDVIIPSRGWSRSPGIFRKIDRVTPSGRVVVGHQTFDGNHASGRLYERGGRDSLLIATEEHRQEEKAHQADLVIGRLLEDVGRIRHRDVEPQHQPALEEALRQALKAAGVVSEN
jgi:hypothetical protein